MNKHKHYARWSDRVTDPADKRAQVNIRLHPARRDELDDLARMHQVTRSRMIETLIETAWQEIQGQTIDPATIERGEVEQLTSDRAGYRAWNSYARKWSGTG